MEIAPATAQSTAAAQTGQGTNLASDFDTFLTLLTAQIRNQDPLNPADSTEYATQLATFSNVEQAVRTNTLLESLVARMAGDGLDRLAAWIGMEARTTGATEAGGGEAVTLEAALPPQADAAVAVITGADGTEVGRMAVDADADVHTFVPTGFDGQALPPGTYAFHLEPSSGGAPMMPVAASRYVTVREALIEGGETILVLDGGARVAADAVTGLRPPRDAPAA